MFGPESGTGTMTKSGIVIESVKLAEKGMGGAVHWTGYSCVDEDDAGREGMSASWKMVHHLQLWNIVWAGPKQREGGRTTEKSTCEEEWKQEEGEVGKEAEEKDVGGQGYGY